MKSRAAQHLCGVEVQIRKMGLEPSCICIKVMGMSVPKDKRDFQHE